MVARKISIDDTGARVSIITGLFLTYTILCYLTRLLMRFTINGPFQKDDAIVSIATIFATIQSGMKLSEAEYGLGKKAKTVSVSDTAKIYKMEYVSGLFYIIALTLSKIAACALIERLSRQRNHLAATRVGYGIVTAWGVASTVAVGVQCPGTLPWTQLVTECPDLYNRWIGVEIAGIFIELYLFWLPVYLVWGLHMSRGSKFIVVLAFSFRLPVILTSAVRMYYLHRLFSHHDGIYYGAAASVCMEAELHYSLMAATIPCLKPFMKSLNTGYLSTRAEQTAFGDSFHSNSYPLKSLSSQRGKDALDSSSGPPVPMPITPMAGKGPDQSWIGAAPEDDDNESAGTNSSDKMFIKCTTSWDVTYAVDGQRR